MYKIDVFGCPHHVESTGSGTPLVFVHGLLMDHTIWRMQADDFSKRYQTVLYDIRGHGKTPCGELQVTFNQLADDLAELIRKMGLQSPVLIGYSTGAAMILNTLVRHPGIAKAGILTGAVADGRGTYLALADKLGTMAVRKKWKAAIAFLLACNHATSLNQFLTFYASVMKCDLQAADDMLHDLKQFDVSAELKNIRTPLLLLYGTRERYSYRKEIQAIMQSLNSAQLQFIPGVRHATLTKKAGKFHTQVNEFLNSLQISTNKNN